MRGRKRHTCDVIAMLLSSTPPCHQLWVIHQLLLTLPAVHSLEIDSEFVKSSVCRKAGTLKTIKDTVRVVQCNTEGLQKLQADWQWLHANKTMDVYKPADMCFLRQWKSTAETVRSIRAVAPSPASLAMAMQTGFQKDEVHQRQNEINFLIGSVDD